MRKSSSEQKLLNIIREEYNNRLVQIFAESVQDLFEVDVVDSFGNTIITKGLKVKHKKSGYEYTVDHIEGKGEDAQIVLRSPESPRFKPADTTDVMSEADEIGDPEAERIKVDQVDLNKVMSKDTSEEYGLEKSVTKQDPIKTIKVPRKEFEKQYEVR